MNGPFHHHIHARHGLSQQLGVETKKEVAVLLSSIPDVSSCSTGLFPFFPAIFAVDHLGLCTGDFSGTEYAVPGHQHAYDLLPKRKRALCHFASRSCYSYNPFIC